MEAGQLALEAVPGTLLDEHADLDVAAGEERIAARLEEDRALAHRAPVCRCIPGPLAENDERDEMVGCIRCGRPVEDGCS